MPGLGGEAGPGGASEPIGSSARGVQPVGAARVVAILATGDAPAWRQTTSATWTIGGMGLLPVGGVRGDLHDRRGQCAGGEVGERDAFEHGADVRAKRHPYGLQRLGG